MNTPLRAYGGVRTDFKSPKTGKTLGFRQSLILLLMLSFFGNAWGQVSMSSTGSYTQDFNSLISTGTGTWTDNSTVENWYAKRSGTGTSIVADLGSANGGNLYSYGSSLATERALGSLGSSNAAAGNFAYGVLLRNTSASTISNIKISYTLEQWRNGGANMPHTLTFYYKISSSTISDLQPNNNGSWTPVSALNSSSPINGSIAATLNGNLAVNKITKTNITIPSLSLAANEYIMLKWDDPDHTGSDSGLSIDDVTIQWTVTPSNFTVTYDGNTSDSGTAPVDSSSPYVPSSTVTVLGKGTLAKTGYTFLNWNTAANGSGTSYSPADTFSITANTILYAQWQQNAAITLSDNTPQVVANNVIPGTDNIILSQFKIDVANQNSTLTEASVLFNGTYSAADIKSNGFKLWYKASNGFSGATLISAKSATASGGEVITFNGLSQVITKASTGYFWVTADIASTATQGNKINLESITPADVLFSSGDKSGLVSAGGIQTFVTLETIAFGNLQWPSTILVDEGNSTATVYAQAWQAGLTDAGDQAPGLVVWIGVSPKNAPADSDPASWTQWIPAPWESQQGNNDQYSTAIDTGALNITPGTYRYASRFQLNGGPYKYGGFSGGFWDGTSNVSGTLTVNSNLIDDGQVTLNPAATPEGNASTATVEIYEPGLTDSAYISDRQTVQFAYATTDDDPSFWTGWITTAIQSDAGNNDKYSYTLPNNLTPGTYYVAARVQKAGSTDWQYFGKDWGTWSSSAVLTVVSNVVTYANIQNPYSGTITQGGDFNVYAQVYKDGVTDIGAVESSKIKSWIGISTTNATAVSDFSTWTWIPATYNTKIGNNFEYVTNIAGASRPAGTYYYVSRFQVAGSTEYRYGGTNNAFWTGPENSGVLTVQTPREINVKQGTTTIADNSSYAFGNQVSGTSSSAVTFTVENTGQESLSVGELSISGADASQFSITQVSAALPQIISGGGTTTFTVTFSPTSTGTKTAQLLLENNDANENPYRINLTGTGNPVNDLCADAIGLVVNDPAVNGAIVNATSSPSPFTGTSKDVWYKFTPSCDGKYTIDLVGTTGRVNIWLHNACATTSSPFNTATNGNVKSLTAGTTASPLLNGTTYYIRIVADDTLGEAPFTIRVNNQMSIATQPVDATVSAGTAAQFSVSSPANQTGRQWQVSADGGGTWSDIVGAIGSPYTTPSTNMAMNGYKYRVIISNGTCQSVISNEVLLTVTPATISTDMFRSKTSGDWDKAATWISSSDGGTTWLNPATAAPTTSASSVEIMAGHTVKTFLSSGANNLTVHTGATLNLLASLTNSGLFKVEDNATVILGASIANLSTTLWAGTEDFDPLSLFRMTVKNSSADLFAINAGIPTITARSYNGYTALFGNLSLEPSTGWSAFLPSGANYNLTHNDLTLTYSTNSNLSLFSGSSVTMGIGRDFITEIGSSNATSVSYQTGQGSSTLNIRGNFIKKGTGIFTFSSATAGASSPMLQTFNIDGNFIIEFGSVRMVASNSGGVNFGVHLKGNLEIKSGQLFNNNQTTYASSNFNFKGTNQAITYNTSANAPTYINFNVGNASYTTLKDYSFNVGTNSKLTVLAGGTLDFGFTGDTALNILDAGTSTGFTALPGSILKITSSEGVQSTGATGNVQTDTRTFATTTPYADYHFIGNAAQFTGDALPVEVRNLFINNTSNTNEVTLNNAALNVNASLDVQKGSFNLNDKAITGTNTATLNIEGGAALKIAGSKTFPTGFTGASKITFQPSSIVEYGGTIQVIANKELAGYDNLPAYQTLKISGNGVKSAAGTTIVNEMTALTSSTAKLMVPAYDALATPPVHSVFNANGGIHNTNGYTGDFIIENDAMLMQNAAADNSQALIKARRTHEYKADNSRKEYNFLSSPVAHQNMKAIYGNNPANVPFVTRLNEPTNLFVNAGAAEWDGPEDRGKGFAVREPKFTGYAEINGDGLPQTIAQYKGQPNNGALELPLSYTPGRGYNLAGNPYPSNIDLIELYANSVDINSETPEIDPSFRFWDNKVNDIYSQMGGAYTGDSYAVFNTKTDTDGFGVVAPGNRNGGPAGEKTPDRYIKVSQAFMVRARAATAKLKFNNTIRKTNPGTVFFGKSSSKNRYHLELVKSDGLTFQNGIAYFDAGKKDFGLEDTRMLNSAVSDALFTYAGDAKVIINGRSAFTENDVVTVGLRHFTAGTYRIQVANREGVFANGQSIYLKDKQLGILTNLTAGDYSFTSEAGEFTNRFEIVYRTETTLGTGNDRKSGIEVYREGSSFVIRSSGEKIISTGVYDAAGRLLLSLEGNTREVRFEAERLAEGMFVLKTILSNGEHLSKKIRK